MNGFSLKIGTSTFSCCTLVKPYHFYNLFFSILLTGDGLSIQDFMPTFAYLPLILLINVITNDNFILCIYLPSRSMLSALEKPLSGFLTSVYVGINSRGVRLSVHFLWALVHHTVEDCQQAF